MNFADSEEMGGMLRARGMTLVDRLEKADVALVNTCTVREVAEHKAVSQFGRLRNWKDEKPNRYIIAAGCATERAKTEFQRKYPYLDLIVGAKNIESFPSELDAFLESICWESQPISHLQKNDNNAEMQSVTIMRGCNYSCSYCVVPAVRGKEKHRPLADILQETRTRVENGAREIWFLGQTVNAYRDKTSGKGADFADLLTEASRISGLERIRFMSPHPFYVTDRMIEAMAGSQKVVRQLHLPVQSGSTKILEKMRRNYSRDFYLKTVERLRKRMPDLSISTDFVVGFPGETESDFEETLTLAREIGFGSAYCFKYSPRPGTLAAQWEDDVPKHVKEDRHQEILSLAAGKKHL